MKALEERTDEKEALDVAKPVRIRVKDRNILPQMNKVSDQQVKEGEELLIDFKALDIDGDEVTYQVNGLPLGAEVIDVSSGVSQLPWTPTFTASTGQALEVTVSALDPKAAI